MKFLIRANEISTSLTFFFFEEKLYICWFLHSHSSLILQFVRAGGQKWSPKKGSTGRINGHGEFFDVDDTVCRLKMKSFETIFNNFEERPFKKEKIIGTIEIKCFHDNFDFYLTLIY